MIEPTPDVLLKYDDSSEKSISIDLPKAGSVGQDVLSNGLQLVAEVAATRDIINNSGCKDLSILGVVKECQTLK